ncbi:MAG: hypothetical protein ROZ64_04425 [Burkholderiaceae bacterium]|jgi:hypothetical protein|nr:hypothetical protein [Burkholderiaceae bacterium]
MGLNLANTRAVEAIMRAVAGVLKPELARIHRRAESADQLIDDLERRLTLAEQRLAALEWEHIKPADADTGNPSTELMAARHSRSALGRIARDA